MASSNDQQPRHTHSQITVPPMTPIDLDIDYLSRPLDSRENSSLRL